MVDMQINIFNLFYHNRFLSYF